MTRVVVDLAYEDDENLEQVITDLEKDYGIGVEVVKEYGTGGGWPEVALTGDYEDVVAALQLSWGLSRAEIVEMCGEG